MFKLQKKRLIYLAVSLSCLILFASIIPATRPLGFGLLKFPLQILTIFGNEVKNFFFFHRNYIRNQRLEKENALLQVRLSTAQELSRENQRLKGLLNLKEKSSYRVVAASVIGRPTDNWNSAIFINKGTHHGIRRGLVVLGFGGLAGRVIEVSQFASRAVLINDSSLNISALDQRSRQQGLVSGTLGSGLIMRYLPKDADVKSGDEIITSGLTENYPKGLRIGTVIETGEEFSGLARYAVIKPAVDLCAIEEVLVIIP